MSERPDNFDKLFAETPNDNGKASSTHKSSRSKSKSRRRKKKSHALRNSLIVVGSLVALLAIGGGIAWALFSNMYNDIQRVSIEQPKELVRPEPVVVEEGAQAPINILLLGSDSRQSTDRTASTEDLTGFRSDAILVAQVSSDREHLTVMSIMRDNWVEIQGHGEAKINAAFSYGGLPLAVNTIENFIGARIDHVALVDFESFKGLTDAVGGVTVYNPNAFTNQNGGNFSFEAGDITLDGDRALAFVRERYAFVDGDYQRARNQQAYLKGLMSKLLSSETVTSVDKMSGSFQALKPYLILDESLDLGTAVGLGYDMRNLRGDDITFFTSPTLGVSTSADGQSIILPNWAEIENVRAAFRDGTLWQYAESQPAESQAP